MLIAKIRNDPHQWVRFEAIHCVAAICSAYEAHIQEQFHALVAPGLASAMEAGRNCMRVRGHAASATQIFARPGKCEDGARMVQGGCRDGAMRVRGGCKKERRRQEGCKGVQGGCKQAATRV